MGWEWMDWIQLTQDGDKWRAVLNTTVILRDSTKCGEYLGQLDNCWLIKEGPFFMDIYI
jgi:hypothetical protein